MLKSDKRLSEPKMNLWLSIPLVSEYTEELCVFYSWVLFQHSLIIDVLLLSSAFGRIYQRSGSTKVSLCSNFHVSKKS